MADALPNLQIDPGAVRAPHLPSLPTPRVAETRVDNPQVMTPQVMTPHLAELQSPLRDLSASLAKGSDESNEVAKLFAKQAGYQAVTRDDDGNLVIAKAPIVGDAAIAYHSAVKFSALTFGESEAKRQDLVLSKQYHDNPDGYLEAAEAFRKKHVDEFAKTAGPDVGAMLNRSIETNTTQNYRWLVLEQQRNIKHQFDQGTKAKLDSVAEDAISLIQSGAKPGDPQLQSLIDQYIATSKLRVQNPVLGESPDVSALRLKTFDTRIGGAQFVAGLSTILQNPAGGVGVAQKLVDEQLTDTKLPPAQRVYNYAEGQKAIKDHQQNLERQITIGNKIQKLSDEQFEDAVIKDSASGNPTVTENDIKNAQGVSPEAKMRMLAWQKRDGMPEPLARVSQANTMDLFKRMSVSEDDPSYIKDLTPVRNAYVKGEITRQDEEWLEKRFKEGQSPDGSPLTKQKERVIKAAAFDRSSLMSKDTTGPLAEYQYRKYVDQRIDDYRQQKKDPNDLFNPSKPDFIAKPEIIQYFRATMDEQIKASVNKVSGRPGAPPPGLVPGAPSAKPTRQPGESPADFLKRTGGGL